MAPERVYEIAEAAPLLKVTENWLKVNARLHGWGTKLGRKRLFTETHLAEILASGVERPTRAGHPRAPRIKAAKSHAPEALSTDRAVTPLRARPEAARSYGRTRIIRIAADLQVGDWLRLGDREVMVTHLNPPTRDEALKAGRREVWSMTTCLALDADDPVTASPRELGQAVAR